MECTPTYRWFSDNLPYLNVSAVTPGKYFLKICSISLVNSRGVTYSRKSCDNIRENRYLENQSLAHINMALVGVNFSSKTISKARILHSSRELQSVYFLSYLFDKIDETSKRLPTNPTMEYTFRHNIIALLLIVTRMSGVNIHCFTAHSFQFQSNSF